MVELAECGQDVRDTMEENASRFLLIDDSPLTLKALRTILELRPGWNVVAEAKNGTEGLALFHQAHPSVVIVDFQMPGPNGLEVGREIRQSDAKVLLILFTLHDSGQVKDLAKAAGFDAVISKANPFSIVEIIETLNQRTLQPESAPPVDPIPVPETPTALAIPSVATEPHQGAAPAGNGKTPLPSAS